MAPSFMACSASCVIFVISSGVATRRKSLPMTCSRMVAWPAIIAMLSDGGIGAARGEIRRDGPRGIAVGAEDDGGDALRDLRFGERIGFEAVGGVIVDVDEAGGEDETFGVDDLFAGLRFEICGDGGDAVARDADVGFAKRGAGAVGDFGVDDEDGCVRTWSLRAIELAPMAKIERNEDDEGE